MISKFPTPNSQLSILNSQLPSSESSFTSPKSESRIPESRIPESHIPESRIPCSEDSNPRPSGGEGGPHPAPSPAGAGRVRGSKPKRAHLTAACNDHSELPSPESRSNQFSQSSRSTTNCRISGERLAKYALNPVTRTIRSGNFEGSLCASRIFSLLRMLMFTCVPPMAQCP